MLVCKTEFGQFFVIASAADEQRIVRHPACNRGGQSLKSIDSATSLRMTAQLSASR